MSVLQKRIFSILERISEVRVTKYGLPAGLMIRLKDSIPLHAGIDAHLVAPVAWHVNTITIRQRSLLFHSYIVVILPKTAS